MAYFEWKSITVTTLANHSHTKDNYSFAPANLIFTTRYLAAIVPQSVWLTFSQTPVTDVHSFGKGYFLHLS